MKTKGSENLADTQKKKHILSFGTMNIPRILNI